MPQLSTNKFPHKLWRLTASPENNGIQWSAGGDKIIIDRKIFDEECLRKQVFKTKKFLSITKQLNLYGFVQDHHYKGGKVVFRHPLFQKGRPELLNSMLRKTESVAPNKSKDWIIDTSVSTARLEFDQVLKSSMQEIAYEKKDDEFSICGTCCDDEPIKFTPAPRPPPRCDPRLIMWNGSICSRIQPCDENVTQMMLTSDFMF